MMIYYDNLVNSYNLYIDSVSILDVGKDIQWILFSVWKLFLIQLESSY